MYKQISAAAVFAVGVSAHGRLTSPTPRPLGDSFKTACGAQVYSQISSDPNGNIQTMAQVGESQSDYDASACHLWQCRGYQFDDATSDSIQTFTPGQTIDFAVTIAAPHTGVANVSVINLAENSVIAEIDSWSVYASTATGVTANETSFSGTLPSTLPDACATQGGCALQWWWDARSIDQTYLTCVDFVTSGSSSSSSTGSSSSAAASVAASSAAPVASSSSSSSVAAAATTLATSTTSAAAEATTSAAANDNSSTGSDSSTCSKKRRARRAARRN